MRVFLYNLFAILVIGYLFTAFGSSENIALGAYKFNPFTQKLDYYETSSSTSGSQTPWTSNIDGGGYSLSNVNEINIGDWKLSTSTVVCMSPEKCQFECDGTDDHVQIQQAITIASSTGGGTVFVKKGDYVIGTSILLPDNIKLQGEGYSTYIKNKTGANLPVIRNISSTGNKNIAIDNLRVDGNGDNQTVAFSTIYLLYTDFASLSNLWVTGALRTGTMPVVSTFGEGIRLTHSNYAKIDNIYTYANAYDGIKFWASSYATVNNVTARDNGRAGIQITFDADSTTDTSSYNTFNNISVYHSTSYPSASSPHTTGFYIHSGRFNVINNLTVYGTQSGVGWIDGAVGNSFNNATFSTRYTQKYMGVINGEPTSSYARCTDNTFNNLTISPLSGGIIDGTNGRFVNLDPGSDNNTFINVKTSQGGATTSWDWIFVAGSNYNKVYSASGPYGLVWNGSGNTSFELAGTEVATNATTTVLTDNYLIRGDGTKKIQSSTASLADSGLLTVKLAGSATGDTIYIGKTSYAPPYAVMGFNDTADYPAYLYGFDDSALALGSDNTERMRISTNGNVGIGTVSPAFSLDVNGNFRVTASTTIGNLTAPNCDVKADSSGGLYCGTDATGAGESQTPWTSSINGGGYNLSNVGVVYAGQLDVTGDSPTSLFRNTANYQYSQAGFSMFGTSTSLGNNAGVNMISVIMDGGLTQTNFAIDKVDYTGSWVAGLMAINLNTNVTEFYTDMDFQGNVKFASAPYIAASSRKLLDEQTYFTDLMYNNAATFAPYLGVAVSSGSVNADNGGVDKPGVVALRDSTTAGGGYAISTAANAINLRGGEKFECNFYIHAQTSRKIKMGFLDSLTHADPVDGVWLEYDYNASSNQIFGRTANSNTRSTSTTAYTFNAANWYAVTIEVTSNSSVTFSIYNADRSSLLWTETMTTNIPDASDVTGAGVHAYEVTTSAAANMASFDYIRTTINRRLYR